jgi:molybdopterin-containing oxidoreductase family iron-sulfur binding subunit
MKANRRKFLKIAGLATLGWSICPGLVKASSEGGEGGSHIRWGLAIDTQKLTDEIMEKAILACHKNHNVPHIPDKREIKWLWKTTFHKAFPGQMLDNLHAGEYAEKETLVLCNHCYNPPCVRVCPTKATFKRADGITMMDFHRCIGCRYCMAACPYGARSFNFYDPRKFLKAEETVLEFPTRTKGVVEKCLLCYERLDEGKKPYCVEAAEGVIYFGNLNDPESEIRKVLAERYAIKRKPELGTFPSVYYLI